MGKETVLHLLDLYADVCFMHLLQCMEHTGLGGEVE
jgi:hypothetical protein